MTFNEEVYKKINEKLDELGWSEEDSLRVDLNDLTEASNELLQVMQEFQAMDTENEDAVLDILIELQVTLEHLEYHVKSGLPLLQKLIDRVEECD